MNDELSIIKVFVLVDDIVKQLSIDLHPGPLGKLSLSEVLTIMVLHPLLKPGYHLRRYINWLRANWLAFFPELVEYSRITRIFNEAQEFLVVLLQKLSDLNSFGLVADGTTIPTMDVIRGRYAKSFREARKVYCKSKNQWDWGFILELVIDQAGHIAFFSVSTAAEIRQLQDILEDLQNRWVLCDRGNQGRDIHEQFWRDKQISIHMTGGKERQWIENVIGILKNKLGLDNIKVRKMSSFLARVKAILCSYNIALKLGFPI